MVKNGSLYFPFVLDPHGKFFGFLFSFQGLLKERREGRDEESNLTGGRPLDKNNKFSSRNYGKVKKLLLVVLAVLIFVGIARVVGSNLFASNRKAEVEDAIATQDINKEFSFPLRDAEGNPVSDLKYLVEKAEVRDEIIVKGQRANSVKGRTFLIVTLKISNSYSSPIEINTKDYIRLSVNGNEVDWLAPDIHNDPVEIQAISTKFTRVGFAINETDRNLILRVGEINGEKENISLTVK